MVNERLRGAVRASVLRERGIREVRVSAHRGEPEIAAMNIAACDRASVHDSGLDRREVESAQPRAHAPDSFAIVIRAGV